MQSLIPNLTVHSSVVGVVDSSVGGKTGINHPLGKNLIGAFYQPQDPNALAYAIKRSCENKVEVVSLDERECGVRATLNLGHTFGHATETSVGYGHWLHGEAVATGTVMTVDMSHRLGWIDDSIVKRVSDILKQEVTYCAS
ncbi:unnamed protein product [Trifolium pratense]|uniref:Uncharacterized protein n=1 Tax=Trifolium pratense TaxID=57577 RepID=A0ACB0KY01_TRIPR|nr:unnamed protein product [Trifolium pratense]